MPLCTDVHGPIPNIINIATHPRDYTPGMLSDPRFRNYVCFENDVLIPLKDCVVIEGRYYMRSCNPMDYVYDISNLPGRFFYGLKSVT